MKYCIEYHRDSSILDEIDEINIKYNSKETTLITFLETFKEKRVNICIPEQEFQDFILQSQMSIILAIKEKYPDLNFTIRFPYYKKSIDDLISACKDNNIPFFFEAYVRDWDTLYGYISLGVSDVYIVEEMCFSIDRVYAAAHNAKVQVRVYPNVAQSSWNETPALKKFFIRPEDTDMYSKYIDVFEFFGRPDQIDTYYDIYKKKEWFGNLNEIIISLNTVIDNRCIVDFFAERRIKCDKKCLKNRPCNICDRCAELAETLHKHTVVIEHTKE